MLFIDVDFSGRFIIFIRGKCFIVTGTLVNIVSLIYHLILLSASLFFIKFMHPYMIISIFFIYFIVALFVSSRTVDMFTRFQDVNDIFNIDPRKKCQIIDPKFCSIILLAYKYILFRNRFNNSRFLQQIFFKEMSKYLTYLDILKILKSDIPKDKYDLIQNNISNMKEYPKLKAALLLGRNIKGTKGGN